MEKEKIVEVSLKACKELEKYINEEYFPKLIGMHNVNLNYNHIKAKQELVAYRGYFPGPKKKYALNIINMEGVPVNEKDIKGLTTKRSDYSKFTKDNISKIIDMIVLDEVINFSQIQKLIIDKKNEIIDILNKRNLELGRPVNFKNKLEDYKKIPSNVMGMLLWNTIEYEYFIPGTKGYSFPIISVDESLMPGDKLKKYLKLDKIPNYIVVPQEEEHVPDYYVINRAKVLEFSWDNRVNEFIQPIKNLIFSDKKIAADTSVEW